MDKQSVIATQGNTQPWKGMKQQHILQQGWALRRSYWVKEASYKRLYVTWNCRINVWRQKVDWLVVA